MTCSICGLEVGTGVYRDGRGDPAHYWCRELRAKAQAAANAIKLSSGARVIARNNYTRSPSTRRVRR